MSSPQQPDSPDQEQPFITHLVELRDRLLKVVLVVVVVFLGLFYYANDLYALVVVPLVSVLPDGAQMIATKPHGTFFTPMKLALVTSIFITIPVILSQLWAFIAPGLYAHERKLVLPLLISSTLLFYMGMAFAYYVVLPLMFNFFAGFTPEGVQLAPDIGESLDLILKIFFAFGIAFEVPIATILLIWSGITSVESLQEKRPYVFVGAFVIGMLLTPPDVISQILLAVPMYGLFELGLLFSRYFTRMRREKEASEEDPLEPEELDSDEEMDAALDRYEAEQDALNTENDSRKDN